MKSRSTNASASSAARPRRLGVAHVLLGTLWMALLAGGAVLQTQLRFAERDVEIQSRRAQERLASLGDERRELEADVARLRSSEVLRQMAESQLGLTSAQPAAVKRLIVPDYLWEKYQDVETHEPGVSASESVLYEEPPWLRALEGAYPRTERPGAAPGGRFLRSGGNSPLP